MAQQAIELAAKLCRQFEGIEDGDKRKPCLQPYLCPAGVWTIGIGTTRIGGRRVTKDWPEAITEAEAEEYLQAELAESDSAVSRLITVPLTIGQRAALIDFTYNLGAGALQASTLRAMINRRDPKAVEQFSRWVLAGGIKLPGLVRRRAAEAALYAS